MKIRFALGVIVAAAMIAGCSSSSSSTPTASADEAPGTRAIARIKPVAGQFVTGDVYFYQRGTDVKIVVALEKLEPKSVHGIHIHEKGDLSAADLSSAGAHYNPTAQPHAGPHDANHHAGDLGNITADADGRAHLELTVSDISIAGTRNPIMGRSVIIHAKKDDEKSQPSGESGSRIAGGVIEAK